MPKFCAVECQWVAHFRLRLQPVRLRRLPTRCLLRPPGRCGLRRRFPTRTRPHDLRRRMPKHVQLQLRLRHRLPRVRRRLLPRRRRRRQPHRVLPADRPAATSRPAAAAAGHPQRTRGVRRGGPLEQELVGPPEIPAAREQPETDFGLRDGVGGVRASRTGWRQGIAVGIATGWVQGGTWHAPRAAQ